MPLNMAVGGSDAILQQFIQMLMRAMQSRSAGLGAEPVSVRAGGGRGGGGAAPLQPLQFNIRPPAAEIGGARLPARSRAQGTLPGQAAVPTGGPVNFMTNPANSPFMNNLSGPFAAAPLPTQPSQINLMGTSMQTAGGGSPAISPQQLMNWQSQLGGGRNDFGVNPFPFVQSFKPQNQAQVGQLLGVAQQLGNPDLSPTDFANMSRDFSANPALRGVLGF